MPQELFLEQIRRFGAEVLPALQAHQVTASPHKWTVEWSRAKGTHWSGSAPRTTRG